MNHEHEGCLDSSCRKKTRVAEKRNDDDEKKNQWRLIVCAVQPFCRGGFLPLDSLQTSNSCCCWAVTYVTACL